jgi:sigma-B regulation protein RsbU (phosphoserine phosphatase)
MTTTIVTLLASLTIAIVCFIYICRYQKIINELKRQRNDIEKEELRMFDFLKSLGETLTQEGGTNPGTLHRTIVRGAAMVVDAHGAALYLLDKSKDNLVSEYQSEACPMLIPVPSHIAEQSEKIPNTINSYRRLTSIGKDWGPFGEALRARKLLKIQNIGTNPHFKNADKKIHQGVSTIIAPLCYGEKELGILAVANEGGGENFTENDYEVFQSIAEQSAFALGNSIVHLEAVEKKNLEKELNTASEVQRILLPSESPKLEGYKIMGLNVPAKIVSGDYFDFFEINDNHLAVVIADVSGKGVPASLITAMCRSVVRANAINTLCPAEVLRRVNEQLFPDIREDMFISLAFLILEKGTGKIAIARAGHDAPLHFRADAKIADPVQSPGIAIGIDSGNVFNNAIKKHVIHLKKGDILLLYTDGVNEASDIRGEEFGIQRLHKTLISASPKGARNVITEIQESVNVFASNVAQNDDITLIAIEKT